MALSLLLSPTTALAKPIHILKDSFGSPGSGAGQLSLHAFGYSFETSSFHPGSGIATTQESGDVYVADTGNHRVDQFDAEGNFVRAWGFGVLNGESKLQACTTTCQAGIPGSAPGQLSEPAFVAVDNSPGGGGDVYVADNSDQLITKYDAEGHLVKAWGKEGQLGETPTIATGTGDIAEGSATGTGDIAVGRGAGKLTEGSNTVTGVVIEGGSASNEFTVGMEFGETSGIPDGTKITAVGPGTLTLSNPATETGERSLRAGSRTITNVHTSSGAFVVGLGIEGSGFYAGNYIAAVGSSTITLARPALGSSGTAVELTTNHRIITNVHTITGTFEAFQTIFGAGIPAGTKLNRVGPEDLELRNAETTVGGTGITLSAKFDFGPPAGIAVDPGGNLWVHIGHDGTGGGQMIEFGSDGGYVKDWEAGAETPYGIATDSSGDLYVVAQGVTKYESSGAEIGSIENVRTHDGSITGLAVDPANNDVYVDNGPTSESAGTEITRFGSTCEPAAGLCTPAEVFGIGTLVEAQGLAVGGSHVLYAADAGDQTIKAFEQVNVPSATTGQVSDLQQETATLNGTVNPEGVSVQECFFEYVEAAEYEPKAPNPYAKGQTAPCVESAGSGNSPVAVHADVSGLAPVSYHFRLVAKNENGTDRGVDQVLGASVDSSSISSASFNGATFSAQIDPNDIETSCQLQYVSEASFKVSEFTNAKSIPCEPGDLGSGSSDQSADATITGLTPATVYRYRFLATSAAHTTEGPTQLLYTYSNASASSGCANEVLRTENTSLDLPDCRAYEQVSPNDNAEAYIPDTNDKGGGVTASDWPMQASADGGSIVYVGEANSGQSEGAGNAFNGGGDEHYAARGPAGWVVTDIAPLGSGGKTYYEGFPDDVSMGILKTGNPSEPLPTTFDANCLYSRDNINDTYSPVIAGGECGSPFFVGSSSDASHLLFESAAARTPEAKPGIEPENGNEGTYNLYDLVGGQLHLVNILPGGEPAPDPNATVGSRADEPGMPMHEPRIPAIRADNVVSVDGSRIFWTDLNTGIVYVRENPSQAQSKVDKKTGKCTQGTRACTVQVSAGSATYQTATPDGRYAYYTESGELWRFDTQEESREVLAAGSGAKVVAVIGVNKTGEGGSYLYFVAEGGLAAGAEARKCEAASSGGTDQEKVEAVDEAEGKAPQGRGCNLYLMHAGQIKFIAVLSPADNQFAGYPGGEPHPEHGDWRPILGYRSAKVTPDGLHLVFMSERRLTAYDNVDSEGRCGSGAGDDNETHSCSEVYVYDAEVTPDKQISCASCNPSGVPPVGAFNTHGAGTFLPLSVGSITNAPRWISADGSRIFFNSSQRLLPNSKGSQGVYEWERQGAGSCVDGSPFNGGGCLHLLSGAEHAFLVDTDESGDNAFFVTRAALSPSDQGDKPDLYDARVSGGFPIPPRFTCESGEACHGPLPLAPSVQAVGSASFQGNEPSAGDCGKKKAKKHHQCAQTKHRKSRRHHKRHRSHKPAVQVHGIGK